MWLLPQPRMMGIVVKHLWKAIRLQKASLFLIAMAQGRLFYPSSLFFLEGNGVLSTETLAEEVLHSSDTKTGRFVL